MGRSMESQFRVTRDMRTSTDHEGTSHDSCDMETSLLFSRACPPSVQQEPGPLMEETVTIGMAFYSDPMLQAMGLRIQEQMESYLDSDSDSDDHNAPLLRPNACPCTTQQHTPDADMDCLLREMYVLCVSQQSEEEQDQQFHSVYDLGRDFGQEDRQSDTGESEISLCSTSASGPETPGADASDDDHLCSTSKSLLENVNIDEFSGQDQ